ncbi:MAG TPA: HIT domain-containing protein [Pyrinomonadaceae bacterium]
MDRLWTPWRYQYISGAAAEETADGEACVLCRLARDEQEDEQNFVLHRAARNYVVLNLYPYTSGHLMIAPYLHEASLDALDKETTDELMDLAKRAQTALRDAYRPHGFNLGMNLGRVAGAGVAGHVHLHALPRWAGDANFMSVVGETRVLPEDLPATYKRLRELF